ncbi:hypothetical protein EYC80_006161 [Monilinia laxa]|uniref:Uncharacterized protein n=1 Tax=Monilinia laxa TaxID=61186 RepID=A0A5N6KGJ2_MONLA|nr:hypothetical protein EYC80_006161 [Monilinia laxa]
MNKSITSITPNKNRTGLDKVTPCQKKPLMDGYVARADPRVLQSLFIQSISKLRKSTTICLGTYSTVKVTFVSLEDYITPATRVG